LLLFPDDKHEVKNMDVHRMVIYNGKQNGNGIPAQVQEWKWWASVKDRYFDKIRDHAASFGTASAFPDIERMSKVRIFDTTCRDGMQMPDAFLTEEKNIPVMQNKVDIAVEMAKWGIPLIEVGSAMSSPEEKGAIKEAKRRVVRMGLSSEIVSLARTERDDIDHARESDADIVHIFSSGSIPHTWVKFGKMPSEVIGEVIDAVRYAQKVGFTKMVVSLEDAARADPDHLVEVARRLYEVAGDSAHYNIPDTVGVAEPVHIFSLISYIRSQVPGLPLQVHCHNDLGRALDNSIAAIYAGVSEVHATMHCMGERTGNAALEQIIMNIYTRYGIALVAPENIMRISNFITERSGLRPPVNAPVVGKNAFWHESGVHGDAVDKSQKLGFTARGDIDGGSIYACYNPTLVGRTEKMGVGPTCGKASVRNCLAEFGVIVRKDVIQTIVDRVKKDSASKKVSEADFLLLTYEIVAGKPYDKIKIEDLEISTGTMGPSAYAKLRLEDRFSEAKSDTDANGPVDAAVSAIKKAIGRNGVNISDYASHAMGAGSHASARVTVSVMKGKQVIESSSVGTDTALAPIDAFVKGFNAMCALEELQQGSY
jgi:2-isopropylmalate synthase